MSENADNKLAAKHRPVKKRKTASSVGRMTGGLGFARKRVHGVGSRRDLFYDPVTGRRK